MGWLGWMITYALAGIVLAEVGFRGARNESQHLSGATYLVCVAFWPIILGSILIDIARGK